MLQVAIFFLKIVVSERNAHSYFVKQTSLNKTSVLVLLQTNLFRQNMKHCRSEGAVGLEIGPEVTEPISLLN